MSDYITYHNVPLIDEHVMTDEDGKPVLTVDESVLRKIAARNNQRVRETGDQVPTIIGHTKGEPGDYVPEEQQPPILDAWWSNFKVIPFLNTGKKCVAATLKFHKSLKNKIRKYPRRSVELWLGDWKIDPVALLGATTPSRDLGLLRLAADGRKVYRRVLPTKGNMNSELVQELLKALEQTDVFQWAKKKMQEEEGQADMEGLDEQAPVGEPAPEGGDTGLYDEEVPQDGEEPDLSEEQEEGKAPVKMSGASCASGTNTGVPGTGLGRKRPREQARLQATGDRIRMSRLERENAQLKDGFKGLRLKLARAERERDLVALQAEGLEFDLPEELDDVAGMDDGQYERHLTRMRKRYSRSLTATADWSEHSRTAATSGITSKEQAIEVAEYARGKGITSEQARTELGLD